MRYEVAPGLDLLDLRKDVRKALERPGFLESRGFSDPYLFLLSGQKPPGTTTRNIGSGGDDATINAFFTWIETNKSTLDDDYVGSCYDDSDDSTTANFSGVTVSSYYVKVTVATGHRASESDSWEASAAMVESRANSYGEASDFYYCDMDSITIDVEDTVLEHLCGRCYLVLQDDADDCILRYLSLHTSSITIEDNSSSLTTGTVVHNSFLSSTGTTCIQMWGTCSYYVVTGAAYGASSSYVFRRRASTFSAYSCWAFAFHSSAACYSSVTMTNCVSDDATGSSGKQSINPASYLSAPFRIIGCGKPLENARWPTGAFWGHDLDTAGVPLALDGDNFSMSASGSPPGGRTYSMLRTADQEAYHVSAFPDQTTLYFYFSMRLSFSGNGNGNWITLFSLIEDYTWNPRIAFATYQQGQTTYLYGTSQQGSQVSSGDLIEVYGEWTANGTYRWKDRINGGSWSAYRNESTPGSSDAINGILFGGADDPTTVNCYYSKFILSTTDPTVGETVDPSDDSYGAITPITGSDYSGTIGSDDIELSTRSSWWVGAFEGPAAASGAMIGSSAGVGAASGVLAGSTSLVASSAGVAAATGVLGGSTSLVASSAGVASASGVLAGTTSLVGSSAGVGSATGVLAAEGVLVGSSAGTGAGSGVLAGTGALVGSAAGVAVAEGALAAGAIAGSAAGVASASGVLAGLGALVGSAAGAATAEGILASGAMIGSSAGSGSAAGALAGLGALVASTVGTGSASGVLAGGGALAGSGAGAGAGVGVLGGTGSLVGSVSGVGAATGILVGSGGAIGSAAGVASGVGVLGGTGSLVGLAAGVAVAVGRFAVDTTYRVTIYVAGDDPRLDVVGSDPTLKISGDDPLLEVYLKEGT